MDDNPKPQSLPVARYTWVLIIIWTILLGLFLAWTMVESQREVQEEARIQARTAYDKDVLYRRWNAGHGGVYAPVTEETTPNPYLSDIPDRDITTPSGVELTLINPAYMTRQVHTLGEADGGVLGHITSLKPIRPENKADPWETEALRAFEEGLIEYSSIESIGGKEHMRLMRPLITEEGCLKCHSVQGYEVGDIRGGISVSVPMEPLLAVAKTRIFAYSFGIIFLWLIGLGGIFFGRWHVIRTEGIRNKATKDLAESEERYHGLFDYMSSGVAVYEAVEDGADFIFKDFNQAGEQIENITRDELLGKKVTDVFPGVKEFGIFDVFQRVWRTGKSEHHPISIYKDQRIMGWRENYVYKLPTGEIVAVYDDVTEQKKAEDALKASEERFREMADLLPQPVFELNLEGNFTYGNRSGIEVTGYSQEDIDAGVSALQLYIPEERERVQQNIKKTLLGIEFDDHEYTILRKDGTTFPAIVSSVPILRDNIPQGLRGIVVDITDRKKAEEDIKKYTRELEESNHMKDLFSDILRHDILTPVTVIRSGLEVLSDELSEKATDSELELLEMMLNNVHKQIDLVDSATNLSKLTSVDKMEKQSLDLKGVIEIAVTDVRFLAEDGGIQIENKVIEAMPLNANTIIKDVFLNLLSNAIKYAPEGKKAIIEASKEDGSYTISVTDFGPGISDEHKTSIFERFKRRDKKGVKGSGLGLAIVKRIVDLHQGKVWVEDNPEGGSIFYVSLPK